jgi:transcriptional regulator with XRE-family HTH domain
MSVGQSSQPVREARSARPENGAHASPAADRSLERALGVQIRSLRRQRDLSVSDLAGAAGISTGMLSKIENGQISPSLSTLHSLAQALSTPVSSLFANFEERQDCSYVPAGQGVVIERRGTKAGHVYQLLGHALSGDVVVEPFLIELKEDAAPYTGFQHAGTEFIYMLSGEVVYRHGDRTHHLKPGDAVLFDSGALHGPETLVRQPISYLSVIIYPRSAS